MSRRASRRQVLVAVVTVRSSYDALPHRAEHVRRLLAGGDVVLVLGRPGRVDVDLLGVLARLALLAGRCQVRLRVVDVDDDVKALAGLTGLDALMGDPPERCCRTRSVEVVGQAEPGEDRRVDEGVDVGDPPA